MDSETPCLRQKIPITPEDRVSLRFSGENQDYNLARLSYSTDGTDINFVFEDEDNVSNYSQQSTCSGQQKKSIRKKIFEKYHKIIGEREEEESSNEVLSQFDRLFNLKKTQVPQKKSEKQSVFSRLFHKKKSPDLTTPQHNGPDKSQPSGQKKDNISSLDNISAHHHEQQGLTKDTKKPQELNTCQTLGQMQKKEGHKSEDIRMPDFLCDLDHKNQKQVEQTNYMAPLNEESQGLPIFIRKLSFLNSIYPNFYNPTTNIKQEMIRLQQICGCLAQSHAVLKRIAIDTFQFIKKPKYLNRSITNINYFLTSKWQLSEPIKNTELIKPHQNIPATYIRPDVIIQALNNYQQVIHHYRKILSELKILKQNKQTQIQWYKNIRSKFWSLQRNLKSISEDLYMLSLERQYPNYIYWYLNVLKSQTPKKGSKRMIESHRRVLGILMTNRQKGEMVSTSQVGSAVKNKLERELQYLN